MEEYVGSKVPEYSSIKRMELLKETAKLSDMLHQVCLLID